MRTTEDRTQTRAHTGLWLCSDSMDTTLQPTWRVLPQPLRLWTRRHRVWARQSSTLSGGSRTSGRQLQSLEGTE